MIQENIADLICDADECAKLEKEGLNYRNMPIYLMEWIAEDREAVVDEIECTV